MKPLTLKLILVAAGCWFWSCADSSEKNSPEASGNIIVAKTEKANAEALKDLNYLAKNSIASFRSIVDDDREL